MTKATLLPLSTEKVRSLSLGNHMALAGVRSGNGDYDQVVCLLRVVYLSLFMRSETASGADLDLHRRAEAALDACIVHAERDVLCVLHENLFHAVFEATKSVAERLRKLSGLNGDGADLMNKACADQQPVLVLGPLITESEEKRKAL